MQLNKDSHVVTCIDILGYKEVLRRDNKEEIDRIATDFLHFVDINSACESGIPYFKHVTYTDNFLFYYKLDYNSSNRIRHDFIKKIFGERIESTKDRIHRVLYYHVFNLALSQFDLAANNMFIRGGLTIGGFNADGKIISGSGLIDAHDLEEKAVYPRIILNQDVVKEFLAFRSSPLLYDVEDEIIFIDFLSAREREYFHHVYDKRVDIDYDNLDSFKSELANIRDNIVNAIHTNINDRVIKKYEWLARYFNYFCYSHKDLDLNELVIETHKDVNECMKGFHTIINEN